MKIERAAAVPLITHDPYFSIWCGADTLNGADLIHWSGLKQTLRGWLEIDGVPYSFMGSDALHPAMEQTGVEVTPTSTVYTFRTEKAALTVRFTSPLLLEDPVLASRPCSYLQLQATAAEGVQLRTVLRLGADIVRYTPDTLFGFTGSTETFRYAMMGRSRQHPLGHSGDNLTIDWGYLYLANADAAAQVAYCPEDEQLTGSQPFDASGCQTWVVAYDDVESVHYFGTARKGLWTTRYATVLDAVADTFAGREAVLARCAALDARLEDEAYRLGGTDYQYICCMTYRHDIAAHKIIADENGELIFLSKENDSNGCVCTVDLTYPSAPLFLLENPEFSKGMLRPVFRFAQCPVWGFDYAPHDLGRYPYADGQVYGLRGELCGTLYSHEQGAVHPPYYAFPAGSDIYTHRNQMPVEESGNMLIITAAVCIADGSADFAAPYADTLQKWVRYLVEYGADPGEQLCTDDFAGHLAHNVNLAAKAILGIEAYAQIEKLKGNADGYAAWHKKAADMAADWCVRADAGDHYRLAFDRPDSWSLKYNLVWDKLFDSRLFPQEVFDRETAWYCRQNNPYGVPLDCRADYTKSDWVLWCAAMGDRAVLEQLAGTVARFERETPSRYPFSDWFDTVTGVFCHFKGRSVQAGMFMPLLVHRGLK